MGQRLTGAKHLFEIILSCFVRVLSDCNSSHPRRLRVAFLSVSDK
jgi:hypothetical protein